MRRSLARRSKIRSGEPNLQPVTPPPQGGQFRPLSDGAVAAIVEAALSILARTGVGACPPPIATRMIAAGATMRDDGRLCFPKPMVETAIARAAKRVNLPGFVENMGLSIGGGRVHIGTGGAATEVLDSTTCGVRGAELRDLFDLMRLVGRLPNIHYGLRPVIARDMEHPFLLDLNTGFACLKACPKPIGISFDNAAHLAPTIAMFDAALGAEGAFRTQPFCFGVIVHAVSPLRYAAEGVEVMQHAIRHHGRPRDRQNLAAVRQVGTGHVRSLSIA